MSFNSFIRKKEKYLFITHYTSLKAYLKWQWISESSPSVPFLNVYRLFFFNLDVYVDFEHLHMLFIWGELGGLLLVAKDFYFDGPAHKKGKVAILKRDVCVVRWHDFTTPTPKY